jgi:hypothetical protein
MFGSAGKRFLFIRPSPPHSWSMAFKIKNVILWMDGWPLRCGWFRVGDGVV